MISKWILTNCFIQLQEIKKNYKSSWFHLGFDPNFDYWKMCCLLCSVCVPNLMIIWWSDIRHKNRMSLVWIFCNTYLKFYKYGNFFSLKVQRENYFRNLMIQFTKYVLIYLLIINIFHTNITNVLSCDRVDAVGQLMWRNSTIIAEHLTTNIFTDSCACVQLEKSVCCKLGLSTGNL